MAKNTINFAGRTLDQNEFTRVVRQNANQWIKYQQLKPKEAEAFQNSLDDILDGMYSGRYSVTSSGALSGKAQGQYAESKDFREGFNPDANAMGYLNNLAGRMKEVSATDPDTKTTKAWDRTAAMGQYISDAIFGEGNSFSKEQLMRWADNYDAADASGVRGTAGRVKFLQDQLQEYKKAIESGAYGNISDEDKQKELAKIDSLLNNGFSSWEVGKLAPWATHLLFTDKEYYDNPTDRQAAIDAAEAKRVQDTLDAGGNPYEEGSDEYNDRARELRQNELNKQFSDWINADYSGQPSTTTLYSGHNTSSEELSRIYDNLANYDWNAFYNSLQSDLNGGFAALDKSYNPSSNWAANDPGAGFAQWLSWNKKDTAGLQALNNDAILSPFTSVVNPEGLYNKQFMGGYNYFTPLGYKQWAYSTGLEALRRSGDLEDYKVGNNTYALVDTMDKDGNLLLYVYKANGPQITKTNIRALKDSAPETFWKLVGDRYAKLNNINLSDGTSSNAYTLSFRKKGGILEAQQGIKLSAGINNANAQEELALDAMSPEERQRYLNQKATEEYGNREINGLSELSSVDKARIASIGMDVASLIAAQVPTYGTAAGAALGLGSTATSLVADFNDPGVSTKQALTGLGANLGLDLLSLVPVAGTASGLGKIAKTAKTVAPKLLAALSLVNVPGAVSATKKLINGENLTVSELRDLSYGISAITGVGRGITSQRRLNPIRERLPGSVEAQEIHYKNAKGEIVKGKISSEQLKSINSSKSNDEALTALKAAVGDDGAQFAYGETFTEGGLKNAFKGKKLAGKTITESDPEALARAMDALHQENLATRTRAEQFGTPWERRLGRLGLATDTEMAFGGTGQYMRSMKAAKGALNTANNRAAFAKAEADAKAAEAATKTQSEVLDGLNGRKYNFETEQQNIYEGLKSANSAKHVANKGGDAGTLRTQLQTNEAAIAADERAFGAANRAEFEARWAELQNAARANPKKPKLGEYTKEATQKINTLKSQIAEVNDAINKRVAIGKEATAKQKSTLKDLNEQLIVARKEQATARAKQAEAKRTWDLAQEAERQGEVGTRLASNYKKQDELTEALNAVLNASKNSTKAYNKVKGRLDQLKKLATEPLQDVNRKDLRKTMQTTLNDTEPISAEKVKNFRAFLSDLKARNLSEGKIVEILHDQAFMTKARDAYKFKKGGYIIKGNMGIPIPEPEKPKPLSTSTTVTPPATPAAPVAGTLGGSVGTGVVGTLGGPSANPVSIGAGIINPQEYPGAPGRVGLGINPTDLALTALESAKYGATQGINAGIYQTYLGMRGFHETPLLKHYRQWSAKPLEDQMAKNVAEYRRMGARAAAGTTDQNQAFSWQLAAMDRAMNANNPLAIQANDQIKTTTDQQNATGNENFANMHGVGERNRQGDIALFNARMKAFADYLHKFGTTLGQNITARQHGIAIAGAANDNRAMIAAAATDPTVAEAKNSYQQLMQKKVLSPNTWTEDDEKELKIVAANYKFAYSQFADFWKATHLPTTGTPYAGYGNIYTLPGTFNPNMFRSGGKMEAAEREKTRREYEKIYHDSMKLLVTESNKKLRNSAYAYYRKLFMHSK